MFQSNRLLHVMDVGLGSGAFLSRLAMLLIVYVGMGGCSAHATASFSEREALLAKEKKTSTQMKQGTLKPVPHISIAKNVQSKTQAEELKPQAESAPEKPVSSKEFATAQNPQKKPLKAALTCGRMVLKKGGRASCFAPVRMWREDIEITCNFAVAIFGPSGSLKRLNCEGDVHIVTSDRLGVAQRAIYDEQNQKITLEEEAKLKQRGMQLQGQKVVMDLISEEVSVEGGVQGIYTPQTEEKKKK